MFKIKEGGGGGSNLQQHLKSLEPEDTIYQ